MPNYLGFSDDRTDGCKIRQQQQMVGNKAQLLQARRVPETVESAKFIETQVQYPQLRHFYFAAFL